MAVQTTLVNKPLNPRGNDQSPLAYNRAKLFSGKALDFDGVNDSVSTSLALTSDEVSISFYLNWDDVGTQNIGFICEGSANDKMMIHTGASGAGVNGLQIAINVTNYSVPQIISEGWNHYLITSDRTNLNIYKNGVLFDSRTTDAGAVGITALTLGIRPIGSLYALDGKLSNFKIFNTALTAAQVADLYNNPEKVVPTGVADSALKLWLPMQEGAGTTAYDGSGNGNHGTISGATYTHGIGAPVSQTAVIDWNKGTNTIPESENPDNLPSFDARGFTKNSSTETSPIGTSDAHKYTENNTNSNPALVWSGDYSTGASQTLKVYLKADAATSVALSTQGQTSGGNINVTTEWQQFEVTQSVNSTSGPHIGGFATITQGSGIVLYMWHPQMSYGDSVYIPTIDTAQTSPVLLPQGLTSGRDITGVNLFENVRKQGALNLDGNSWAEVHDNASLDITSAISLECWIKSGNELDSVYDHIFVKQSSDSSWGPPYGRYVLRFRESNIQWWFDSVSNATDYSVALTGWNHLVLTKNGTSEVLYLNGVQVDTNTGAATITASAYSLLIGSRTGHSAAEMIDNQLAQPRIYNRALTAEEVERNYNAGKNIYTNS